MTDSDEKDNRLVKELSDRVEKLAANIEKAKLADYVQLLEHPRKLLWNHFIGGIARGFGITIGFTVLTSTMIYLLRALGALQLPIVGDYIADIVEHVQASLSNRKF